MSRYDECAFEAHGTTSNVVIDISSLDQLVADQPCARARLLFNAGLRGEALSAAAGSHRSTVELLRMLQRSAKQHENRRATGGAEKVFRPGGRVGQSITVQAENGTARLP